MDACGVSVMEAWQSTQFSLPWTDFAKTSGITPVHSDGWPFLRGLNSASWQSMHSLFGTAGGLAVATGLSAPNAVAAMNKNNPVSRWADEVRKGGASLTSGQILRENRTADCAGIARPWAYFGKTAP